MRKLSRLFAIAAIACLSLSAPANAAGSAAASQREPGLGACLQSSGGDCCAGLRGARR